MFLVMELQDNGEHASTLSYEFDNNEDAYAKYHAILMAAAKSTVLHHGAVIMRDARIINTETHTHGEELI